MAAADGAERRRFTRVDFIEQATLQRGDGRWNVELLDISLKGAMVSRPAPARFQRGDPCRLRLYLGDDATVIEMRTRVAHQSDGRMGLECLEIDLDSLTHLRQLIVANVGGGDEAAQRELAELIAGAG